MYFTEPVSYRDYQSYFDSNSSDCDYCKGNGYDDYYNAAKRYCEDNGGRLPTVAELQAGGYNNGGFWASEQSDSDGTLVLDNGYVGSYNKDSLNVNVVCVGK